MSYLILTQDNAPSAHPVFDSLESAIAYFQANSLDAPHYFIADETGTIYNLEGFALCNDCAEPVDYCDEREQWRHIDPKASPCFLVSGSL